MNKQKTITYSDFEQVDIRSGSIVRVEQFPQAKKAAYKVWVDFGSEIGVKQTSAQITTHYKPEELIGRYVAGCINMGTKNIAGFQSEFLLLGFPDERGEVCLITMSPAVPLGKKMF